MLLAGVVVIKPVKVNVRRIEPLVLAKTHRSSFGPAHTIDNRPVVIPLLAFGVTIHKAECAGIAVKDAQRVPHAAGTRIIRPTSMIVVS